MKKYFLSLLLACFVLVTSAQKTVYDANAAVRTVSGFHGIEVSQGIDLYLSYGEEALAVSGATAEYRDLINTEVKNGILKIWYDDDFRNKIIFNNKRALKAYVSYKTLDALSASGGSDIFIEGTLKGNRLRLSVSGGSDFSGKVNLQELKVDQSGGADITISGTAISIDIDASGGSDFAGYDLTVDSCTADASGGSDIQITVTKELTADASGGSDVTYKGAASVKTSKSGGSSVRKAGR